MSSPMKSMLLFVSEAKVLCFHGGGGGGAGERIIRFLGPWHFDWHLKCLWKLLVTKKEKGQQGIEFFCESLGPRFMAHAAAARPRGTSPWPRSRAPRLPPPP